MLHTKGPWTIGGYHGEHDEAGAFIDAGKERICSTAAVANDNWKKYHANAILIAAAPDLLKELMLQHEILSGHNLDKFPTDCKTCILIRKAAYKQD